jgi:hypothetical protein
MMRSCCHPYVRGGTCTRTVERVCHVAAQDARAVRRRRGRGRVCSRRRHRPLAQAPHARAVAATRVERVVHGHLSEQRFLVVTVHDDDQVEIHYVNALVERHSRLVGAQTHAHLARNHDGARVRRLARGVRAERLGVNLLSCAGAWRKRRGFAQRQACRRAFGVAARARACTRRASGVARSMSLKMASAKTDQQACT